MDAHCYLAPEFAALPYDSGGVSKMPITPCRRGNVTINNGMYKKEECRNFRSSGRCKYGEACIFVHGSIDKRSSSVTNGIKSEKGICRFFCKGKCPYYNNCLFLHQGPERYVQKSEVARESSVISIETGQAYSGGTNPWLKTRICYKWKSLTGCPYGAKCTYAHGRAELRQVSEAFFTSAPADTWIASRTSNKNDSADNAIEETVPKRKEAPTVCLIQSKRFKKIVSIYADWIDEESFVPSAWELHQ